MRSATVTTVLDATPRAVFEYRAALCGVSPVQYDLRDGRIHG